MYFVLPLWLAAGFADYLCHRAASIETTSPTFPIRTVPRRFCVVARG
jgi:hypothetical protein